jgi:anti-sigma factor ChrR (cupin superfamily)
MRGLAEIVRLRTGECREAVDAIAQIAAEEPDVDEKAAAHVTQCLRCQAEVAAYRRIVRHLRAMRHEGISPPVGSLAAVLAVLEAAAVEQNVASTTWVVRAAYVGGITVATAAAGAAGVMVWMSRRRLGLADTG